MSSSISTPLQNGWKRIGCIFPGWNNRMEDKTLNSLEGITQGVEVALINTKMYLIQTIPTTMMITMMMTTLALNRVSMKSMFKDVAFEI
jgi:hypothetical protein